MWKAKYLPRYLSLQRQVVYQNIPSNYNRISHSGCLFTILKPSTKYSLQARGFSQNISPLDKPLETIKSNPGIAIGIILAAIGLPLSMQAFSSYSAKSEVISDVDIKKEISKNKQDLSEENFITNWKNTLEKVVPAIETPGNSWASGFVVDSENGIILTNRHVVGPGPVVAEAIFHNNEEVPIIPIYRDPVHDFGFFKYDPEDVRYTDVKALNLCPQKACIGTDIRVVGNDAAEKLAIASGTLARLDREAPMYGRNTYNDFNTFYFQASSGTTGGSSGSPVMNLDGDVIALNAGGKVGTAASFYLPLDRVKRALELIQEGKDVSRGTIQTVFRHSPFDELRRLGLSSETEKFLRQNHPEETGMLVVDTTVPGGPCADLLQPGDVVVSINGEIITKFVRLEEILDNSVQQKIEIQLQRAGRLINHSVVVGDLHEITPSNYLQIGGAIINPLSYHLARNHGRKPGEPFVASAGYFLQRAQIGKGSIILEVDGLPTPTVENLREYFKKCKDGQRVVIKYVDFLGDKRETVSVVNIDKRWFPFQQCYRNDKSGSWDCNQIQSELNLGESQLLAGQTSVLPGKNFVESEMAKSLVTVEYDRPFYINSSTSSNFSGTGIILDATKGIVVVDKNTITDKLGDVRVSFANTLSVPGKVLFVHPVHNFAFVQYDTKLIGKTDVKSAIVSKRKPEQNDKVWLVGLASGMGRSSYSELVSRETLISGINWLKLPVPFPPQYQEHNLEMISLQDSMRTEGGVICSSSGVVQALWASFSYQQKTSAGAVTSQFFRGIPMDIIMESAESLMIDKNPVLRDLGVDLEQISLSKARELGMSQTLAGALEHHDPHRRTALSVMRRWGGADATKKLLNGDIIVSIDDKLVTSFREVEIATQKEEVNVLVIRNGKEMSITLKPLFLKDCDVDRIVFWQGLLLQVPPLSVATQREISHGTGVYVSCRYLGSPAARDGPPPTSRICELDGIEIKNLEDFINAVRKQDNRKAVRIKYIDLEGNTRLKTLKLEKKYWPTSELLYKDGEWHRSEIE